MSDNLTATPGVGANIRFRDIADGGVFGQKVDTAPWEAGQLTGSQLIVVGTTSVGTTGSAGTFTVPAGASHAYISVEGAGIRFWNTGDTPTAGTAGQGHYLATGAGPLELDNIGLLRMVTAGTSSGTVQMSYHRYV